MTMTSLFPHTSYEANNTLMEQNSIINHLKACKFCTASEQGQTPTEL
jgi:hypothetical protein